MSRSTVNQVVQRAIGDAAFRRQLQRDPQNALSGFDLSDDERAAITSGDPTRLTALGVDQRMSKAFGLGGLSTTLGLSGGGCFLITSLAIPAGGLLDLLQLILQLCNLGVLFLGDRMGGSMGGGQMGDASRQLTPAAKASPSADLLQGVRGLNEGNQSKQSGKLQDMYQKGKGGVDAGEAF